MTAVQLPTDIVATRTRADIPPDENDFNDTFRNLAQVWLDEASKAGFVITSLVGTADDIFTDGLFALVQVDTELVVLTTQDIYPKGDTQTVTARPLRSDNEVRFFSLKPSAESANSSKEIPVNASTADTSAATPLTPAGDMVVRLDSHAKVPGRWLNGPGTMAWLFLHIDYRTLEVVQFDADTITFVPTAYGEEVQLTIPLSDFTSQYFVVESPGS